MRRRIDMPIWTYALSLVVALVLGAVAGGASSATTHDTSSSTTEFIPPATDAVSTVPLDDITVPPTTAVPIPAGPRTSFGDGVWEVGTDIAAGKYKAADAGSDCYWAKLKADDSIINNDLPHGPTTVTIEASVSKFKSKDCGEWVKVG